MCKVWPHCECCTRSGFAEFCFLDTISPTLDGFRMPQTCEDAFERVQGCLWIVGFRSPHATLEPFGCAVLFHSHVGLLCVEPLDTWVLEF